MPSAPAGIVTVRPFALDDLGPAARFCEAARALDPSIEPFAQRLGLLATGPRAALPLWRVAEAEDSQMRGIAFAAVRENSDPPLFDVYAAVHPSLRRRGLGRALSGPALSSRAALRARVREDSPPGRAFLCALGFQQKGAQLALHWSGRAGEPVPMPALRVRSAAARDRETLARLSEQAWTGAPDSFSSRPDDLARLFSEEERLVLVVESGGRPLGYLSAVQLGRTLGIEEVAVLPEFRRRGIARALLWGALAKTTAAVLTVAEENRPARALYRSFGFRQASRRLLFERRPEVRAASAIGSCSGSGDVF